MRSILRSVRGFYLPLVTLVLLMGGRLQGFAQTFDSELPRDANLWFSAELKPKMNGCPFEQPYSDDPRSHVLSYDDPQNHLSGVSNACFKNVHDFDRNRWNQLRPLVRDILAQIMYSERSTSEISIQTLRTCPAFSYPAPAEVFRQYQMTPFRWTQDEVKAYGSLPDWFKSSAEKAVWKYFQKEAWESWHRLGYACSAANGDPFNSGIKPHPTSTPDPRPNNSEVSNVGDPNHLGNNVGSQLNQENLTKIMDGIDQTDSGGRPTPTPTRAPNSANPDHDTHGGQNDHDHQGVVDHSTHDTEHMTHDPIGAAEKSK